MITATGTETLEFRGLSTDTKPIKHVGNGSMFFEMDTMKVYMFDAEHIEWLEFKLDN